MLRAGPRAHPDTPERFTARRSTFPARSENSAAPATQVANSKARARLPPFSTRPKRPGLSVLKGGRLALGGISARPQVRLHFALRATRPSTIPRRPLRSIPPDQKPGQRAPPQPKHGRRQTPRARHRQTRPWLGVELGETAAWKMSVRPSAKSDSGPAQQATAPIPPRTVVASLRSGVS